MIGLDKLGSIIKEAGKALMYLALVQNTERERLRSSLLAICNNCEDAFEEHLKVSEEIRASFGDDEKLIEAVRDFLKDEVLASKFKPDHICSETSVLLDDLKNNLKGLRYSVAYNKIDLLKEELGTIHQFDIDLNQQYSMLRNELQELCDNFRIERKELSSEIIKNTLNDFRNSLERVIDSVRTARKSIEQNM